MTFSTMGIIRARSASSPEEIVIKTPNIMPRIGPMYGMMLKTPPNEPMSTGVFHPKHPQYQGTGTEKTNNCINKPRK
jgi:hypothetical protein